MTNNEIIAKLKTPVINNWIDKIEYLILVLKLNESQADVLGTWYSKTLDEYSKKEFWLRFKDQLSLILQDSFPKELKEYLTPEIEDLLFNPKKFTKDMDWLF